MFMLIRVLNPNTDIDAQLDVLLLGFRVGITTKIS